MYSAVRRRIGAVLLMTPVLAIVGCDAGAPMAQVNGKVTFNSQPVPDAFVTFNPQPIDGALNAPTRPSLGLTDSSGAFYMSTNGEKDGAAVGTHKVSVAPKNSGGRLPGKLPPDFTVEVKPGENTIDLELK